MIVTYPHLPWLTNNDHDKLPREAPFLAKVKDRKTPALVMISGPSPTITCFEIGEDSACLSWMIDISDIEAYMPIVMGEVSEPYADLRKRFVEIIALNYGSRTAEVTNDDNSWSPKIFSTSGTPDLIKVDGFYSKAQLAALIFFMEEDERKKHETQNTPGFYSRGSGYDA